MRCTGFGLIKESNNHVVVWSGGCDSSLLLETIAAEFSTKEKPVVAFSMDWHSVHIKKKEMEDAARKKMLKEFKKRGLHIEHHVITINSSTTWAVDTGGLGQAYVWLTHILPYLKQDSNLYFGYIRSDDFWHFVEQAKEVLRWGQQFLNKTVNVYYPLESYSKAEVLNELHTKGLYDFPWFCEEPHENGSVCNVCKPCRTHMLAIVDLAVNNVEWSIQKLPKQLKYIKKHAQPHKSN